MRKLILLMTVVGFFGCSMTGTMIPVRGPMTELDPVPVVKVKADGVWGNTGKLTFTLPGGENCSGQWSSTASTEVTFAAGSLIDEYGSTYLQGYSVSTGSGQNPGAALAICNSGRTVDIQFLTGAGSGHGFGIGKDNRGNVYRLVF